MIRKYLSQSWKLTKSNSWVFVQAMILLIVFSVFTFLLMFPTLVMGLEGMYLKAWQGEAIKPRDVFMYRKRFFPLLRAAMGIGIKIFLWSWVLLPIIFFFPFVATLGKPLSFAILLLSISGWIAFISWKGGRYLHALNLVAEGKIKDYEKLLCGGLLSENRSDSTLLVFFNWIVFSLVFNAPSFITVNGNPIVPPLVSQIFGLILFPIVVGATAMAYAYEIEMSEETSSPELNEPHPPK